MGGLSWCTFQRIGNLTDTLRDLVASIGEAEALRKRRKEWPPPNSGAEKYKDGLKGVMAEEMGWVD